MYLVNTHIHINFIILIIIMEVYIAPTLWLKALNNTD